MHVDTLSNNFTVSKLFQKFKKKKNDNDTRTEHLRNNK